MWGVSFDTKRCITKELSFCTQKLIDGNHIKLGSRAYSQAPCSNYVVNAIEIRVLKNFFVVPS